MCAVIFFPQGFNETILRFEEGYLQEDEGGIFAMDKGPDLTKDKCVNHNFSPRGSREEKDSTFLDMDRFRNTIRCSPWIFVSQPLSPWSLDNLLAEGVQNLPDQLILMVLFTGGEPMFKGSYITEPPHYDSPIDVTLSLGKQ